MGYRDTDSNSRSAADVEFGTIRDPQRAYHGFVHQKTGRLWNLDSVRMAEAMGGKGVRIEHPDQFGDAYREAIRSNISTVVDVFINRGAGIPITGAWQMPLIPEVQPTFGQRKVK